MKILKNLYHKKLFFEVEGKSIGIEGKGIKVVEDYQAKELLKNPWIVEVQPRNVKFPNIKKTDFEYLKSKGRRKENK